MFEMIVGLLAALFCVIGAVSLLRLFALWLTAPRRAGSRAYVIMLKGKDADMELRLALSATEWDTGLRCLDTVAVDCGVSPEITEKCRRICHAYNVRYMNINGYIDDVGTYSHDLIP